MSEKPGTTLPNKELWDLLRKHGSIRHEIQTRLKVARTEVSVLERQLTDAEKSMDYALDNLMTNCIVRQRDHD